MQNIVCFTCVAHLAMVITHIVQEYVPVNLQRSLKSVSLDKGITLFTLHMALILDFPSLRSPLEDFLFMVAPPSVEHSD